MRLNAIQTLIILLAITVGTVITRFLPPILFPQQHLQCFSLHCQQVPLDRLTPPFPYTKCPFCTLFSALLSSLVLFSYQVRTDVLRSFQQLHDIPLQDGPKD